MSRIFSGLRIGSAAVVLAASIAASLSPSLAQAAPGVDAEPRASVRVVGGEKAQTGRFPWMVALVDRWVPGGREAFFCGGVLVGADWVVTAEHCTWGMNKSRIEAVPGAVDLRGDRHQAIGVRDIRRSRVPGLDIALLHLESVSGRAPLRISGQVPEAGSMATALGWGATRGGGKFTNWLRQVDVEVRTLADCRSSYFGAFIPATMLCAGVSGRDTCQGDSGGPLVLDGRLIGITSFGRGCGFWPGVYSRVDSLAPWVRTVVKRDRIRHRRNQARKRAKAKKRAGRVRSVDRRGPARPRP